MAKGGLALRYDQESACSQCDIIPLFPARSTTQTRYRAVVDSPPRTWRANHTRRRTEPYTQSV